MSELYGSVQSALAPHGPEAERIAEIAWILMSGAAFILAAVTVLTALAVRAPRKWLSGQALILVGGIVFPVIVLSALMIYSLQRSPRLTEEGPVDLIVEVVGHQWWWEVNYFDAQGRLDFSTANEINIPVDRVAEIRLRSADVLHSLWVPALAGKLDMIPGRDNRLRIAAYRVGVYRGQCAEYCGGPHGLMALLVVAQDAVDFAGWASRQRLPQRIDDKAPGAALFQSHCAACHTVRGTAAAGRLGPDLTHFGSRIALGAGILPNNVGTIAGWLADGQHIKPGNLMPAFRHFDSSEIRSLAEYLAALE
jgi:cytochrome c oxidase subunit 2